MTMNRERVLLDRISLLRGALHFVQCVDSLDRVSEIALMRLALDDGGAAKEAAAEGRKRGPVVEDQWR